MPSKKKKSKARHKKAVGKSDFDLLKETIQFAKAMKKAIEFELSLKLGEFDVIKGVKLLPTIMACIGADQKDTCPEKFRRDLLVSMFSIVRSTPSLFEYASHESDQDLASDA